MAEHTQIRDLAHPGEVLAEALEERGMTGAELARRAGFTEKHVSQLVNGKASITTDTALLLERVLGIPARLWMSLEHNYRAEKQRAEQRGALDRFADWMRRFPVKEMIRFQIIGDVGRDVGARVEALLQFFGVASPEACERTWAPVQGRFRKSPSFEPDPFALVAWLRASEIRAQEIPCAPYSESDFSAALKRIRGLTTLEPEEFVPIATQLCADAGVALTFVPALPKLAISGVTRWFGQRAAIHLSLRGRTDDQMWFSLFHEGAHVLKHQRNAIYIDDSSDPKDDPIEAEANAFAREMLVPSDKYARFTSVRTFSKARIEAFAKQIGIAPGIVVGMLQHDRLLQHSHCNGLKRRFRWECEGTRT